MLSWQNDSDLLDDINGSEEHELCLVVGTHLGNMRFEYFEYLFPVLRTSSSKELAHNATTVLRVDKLCKHILTAGENKNHINIRTKASLRLEYLPELLIPLILFRNSVYRNDVLPKCAVNDSVCYGAFIWIVEY